MCLSIKVTKDLFSSLYAKLTSLLISLMSILNILNKESKKPTIS